MDLWYIFQRNDWRINILAGCRAIITCIECYISSFLKITLLPTGISGLLDSMLHISNEFLRDFFGFRFSPTILLCFCSPVSWSFSSHVATWDLFPALIYRYHFKQERWQIRGGERKTFRKISFLFTSSFRKTSFLHSSSEEVLLRVLHLNFPYIFLISFLIPSSQAGAEDMNLSAGDETEE